MSTTQMITLTGQGTLNDTDSIIHYGDLRRVYSTGGIRVQGVANLNDTDSIAHYGDIKRIYTPGGIIVSGRAELNDIDSIAHYGDIKRIYTPGGIKISGQATLNDLNSIVHYGDLIKIAFVTLTAMTDEFPMILNITIPSQAIAWMQDEVMTIAWCCKLTRADGVVLGFTSCDHDLVYNGVTYEAQSGFSPTAVSTSDDMSVDNLDNSGMIRSESVTAEDIRLGKYKDASIEVFLCNYKDLTQPVFILRRGTIGEMTYGKNGYTAEIRGLMENLGKKSGKITSKTCRTTLGSGLCKMNLSSYTYSGSVTQVNDDGSFNINVIQSEDYFSYGLITFTSGVNAGAKMEVKKYTAAGRVTLFLPLPNSIELGASFTILAGCDGNATTCRNRFDNLANFRGEPYVPGNNYVGGYPQSASGNIVSEGNNPRRAVYDWGDDTSIYGVTNVIDDNNIKLSYWPGSSTWYSVTFTSGAKKGKSVTCRCSDKNNLVYTVDSILSITGNNFSGVVVGDTCTVNAATVDSSSSESGSGGGGDGDGGGSNG